jgi:hypothetical protein
MTLMIHSFIYENHDKYHRRTPLIQIPLNLHIAIISHRGTFCNHSVRVFNKVHNVDYLICVVLARKYEVPSNGIPHRLRPEKCGFDLR